MSTFVRNRQYYKFCAYGFLKNLRFYDAFLLLFFLDNGISYTQIGIIYATRELVTFFSEIPSGIIADTYGRKSALIASFFFYILSFLLFYVSGTFMLFLFAIVLYGIGDAFRTGTHKGMIMDYLRLHDWHQYKIDYYGHTRSWSQMGSAFSALLAGVLVLYSGNYRFIYLISVFPYLLNLVNIYSYPKSLDYTLVKTENAAPRTLAIVFKDFVRTIKKPAVFQIVNLTAIHTAFLTAIKDYIQPLMVQVAILIPIMVGLDVKRKSGIVIGLIYFVIYLLTSYASKKAYVISGLGYKSISKLTLYIGLASGAICGLLYNTEFWVLALLFFIVIYIVENIRLPILTGDLADQVPDEILTSVISAKSFLATLMTTALVLLLGVLSDHFGIGISLVAISCFLVLFTLVVGKLKIYSV